MGSSIKEDASPQKHACTSGAATVRGATPERQREGAKVRARARVGVLCVRYVCCSSERMSSPELARGGGRGDA